jgi:hypothetical protein
MATKRAKSKASKRSGRKVARKPSRRKAARRPARGATRRTAKRAARKTARRPAKKAAKKAAKKTAKKAARKSATRPARRPALQVVKRAPRPAAPKAAPAPAFAAQRAGASAKEQVLFEMERAHTALAAAFKGLGEAGANTPLAPGKWTPRQIVLHLLAWERYGLSAFETAYARNERPPLSMVEIDRMNADNVAALDHHAWPEAVRLLQGAREDLRAALEAIPDEPAAVWSEDHAVGWLARLFAGHDRHHAGQIKAARVAPAGPGA